MFFCLCLMKWSEEYPRRLSQEVVQSMVAHCACYWVLKTVFRLQANIMCFSNQICHLWDSWFIVMCRIYTSSAQEYLHWKVCRNPIWITFLPSRESVHCPFKTYWTAQLIWSCREFTDLHFVNVCFPTRSCERDHMRAQLRSAEPWGHAPVLTNSVVLLELLVLFIQNVMILNMSKLHQIRHCSSLGPWQQTCPRVINGFGEMQIIDRQTDRQTEIPCYAKYGFVLVVWTKLNWPLEI